MHNYYVILIYVFPGLTLKISVESWQWENILVGVFQCPTIIRKTGSLDSTPVLSSNIHSPPCPQQPTLNKPWSSIAQTAAHCHTLDPLGHEADDGLCVSSNTHVSVKDCQIVSNFSHPTLKYLIL